MRLALLSILALALSACATPQSLSLERAEQDPWEASNRKIYAFNKDLDSNLIKPITGVYRTTVPQAGRTAITNGFSNYGEPQNFFNYLFQGKIKRAFQSLDRFLINSTLGVGGIADHATALGRPRQPTDWGQTFAQWGVKSGPFVMLPFFGPSSLRDGLATPLDFIVDPSDFVRNATLSPSIFWRGGQVGVRVINVRSRVIDLGGDGLLAGSLDEYALVRSAWLQNRRAQLYYGNPPLPPEPADQNDEFSDEFSDEFTPAPASATPPPQ
ncbi:MAG: VacJ family lipoprotein [Polymorphobacter sp.]|uniref:MlaA family lipoprotein n=1 Tax=Polymorphobacter sp. TaxID=1909290 RepID=UPI003A84E1AC